MRSEGWSWSQDWALYFRLLKFARPYWRVVVVLLAAVSIGAAMEPLMPALMKPLVDESLIAKDATSLWAVPLLLVLVVTIRGCADYVVTYSSQYLSQRVVEDFRQALFAIQMDLPLSDDGIGDVGRRMSRITNDTQLVSEAVSEVWLVLIRDTLVLFGLVGFLFYTAWELTLFIFISMPVLIFAVRKISRRLRVSSLSAQAKFGDLTGFLQEAFLGLAEIKLFDAKPIQEREFFRINSGLRKEQMRVVRSSALAGPIVAALTAITVAIVIYFASFMTTQGELTPGEFVSFITALAMVFGPIRRLTSTNIVLQRGLAAAESIFSRLDSPTEESKPFSPLDLVVRHAKEFKPSASNTQLRGGIEFREVWFRYPQQNSYALGGFNLKIIPKERVAIIGPSGSGKSTVLSLIARFYVPERGEILLDDRPLSQLDLAELRSNLGFVSQRVLLFNGTIRQNISLGSRGASGEEIVSAAAAANVLEFSDRLPQGLDTEIGSLGGRLSGGQRQRIAIARALLKNAPILLLDEATSALDRESERSVLRGLETLMQDRTVIFVSHSPERLVGITRTIEL